MDMEYFERLFNKPILQWTALDECIMAGIWVGALVVAGIVCYACCLVYLAICNKKYTKCKNARLDRCSCRTKQCMFCKDYKKGKDNE